MPKNNVSEPITDQEIAFARLVFSGTMTDQRAAEAVGLNPKTAAYTKSKPCVLAYMLEHRAALQQQLVEQEAEGLRRRTTGRQQVLARLWEIANMSPEMTRGSITGQIKVLSMIVAIEGVIQDRVPAPREQTHSAAHRRSMSVSGLASRRRKPRLSPNADLDQEDQEEEELGVSQVGPTPGSAADAPPRTRPLPPLSPSTPANPPSPMARSSRKRNRGIMPPLLQTPGAPSPSQRASLPAALTSAKKRIKALPIASKVQKGRILSNFTKTGELRVPHSSLLLA